MGFPKGGAVSFHPGAILPIRRGLFFKERGVRVSVVVRRQAAGRARPVSIQRPRDWVKVAARLAERSRESRRGQSVVPRIIGRGRVAADAMLRAVGPIAGRGVRAVSRQGMAVPARAMGRSLRVAHRAVRASGRGCRSAPAIGTVRRPHGITGWRVLRERRTIARLLIAPARQDAVIGRHLNGLRSIGFQRCRRGPQHANAKHEDAVHSQVPFQGKLLKTLSTGGPPSCHHFD